MPLPGLSEASGLAVSRTSPGRLWSHNDSGKPVILALDATGRVTGQVAITNARVEDWEALSLAPCPSGWCLYIADIGDNNAKRPHVTIYRVPEPAQTSGAANADAVIRASYPDGAHDAEALLAAPDGTLYVVTKGDTGHIALYRVPRATKGGAATLEAIGTLSKTAPAQDARVTDGAISPDGEWVLLRTRTSLAFYRAAEFLKGDFREARRIDLRSLSEPQGEAVAFGAVNTIYVAGEGGGKSQPGTLAVVACGK
jgi:glucose/arabinose dehydrogenase